MKILLLNGLFLLGFTSLFAQTRLGPGTGTCNNLCPATLCTNGVGANTSVVFVIPAGQRLNLSFDQEGGCGSNTDFLFDIGEAVILTQPGGVTTTLFAGPSVTEATFTGCFFNSTSVNQTVTLSINTDRRDESVVFGSSFAAGNSACAVVLPIDLASFAAVSIEKGVKINWVTLTERNNAYFSIERSTDGARYEAIGKVTGAGNSLLQRDYTYTDERPVRGVNFYRLQQVDFDGQSAYSPVVSVTFGQAGGIRLSPQPVLDQLSVALEQPTAEGTNWQVYDFSGRLLQSGTLDAETIHFDLPTVTLTEGSYVLRLVSGQTVLTQQFQKR